VANKSLQSRNCKRIKHPVYTGVYPVFPCNGLGGTERLSGEFCYLCWCFGRSDIRTTIPVLFWEEYKALDFWNSQRYLKFLLDKVFF
jgi:hypothetical protein